MNTVIVMVATVPFFTLKVQASEVQLPIMQHVPIWIIP